MQSWGFVGVQLIIGLSALTAAAVTVRKVLAERRTLGLGATGVTGGFLNEILLASGIPAGEGGLISC